MGSAETSLLATGLVGVMILGFAGVPATMVTSCPSDGEPTDTPETPWPEITSTPPPVETPPPEGTPPPPTAPPTPEIPRGARVHGMAQADLEDEAAPPLLVPELTVTLHPLAGGAAASVSTDEFGRFRFRPQPPGTYDVCWAGEGYTDGCLEEPIEIVSTTVYPPVILARPASTLSAQRQGDGVATQRGGGAELLPLPVGFVAGRVTLDGTTPCYVDAPFFGVHQTAEVGLLEVLTGLPIVDPVKASADGSFVLPGIPLVGGLLQLVATCGDGSTALSLDVDDLLDLGDPLALLDLTFDTRPPRVGSVSAWVSGAPILRANPGQTVQVRAELEDPDGDPLTYRFKVATGAGSITSTSGATAQWKLPTRPGLHTIYVLASDGNGGVTQAQLPLRVSSAATTAFAGEVVTEDGEAVDAAEVTVNGASTSGALGVFEVIVPEASRYVVTASAEGQVPRTEVLDRGVSELAWPLRDAAEQHFGASAGIEVTAWDGDASGAGFTLDLDPGDVAGQGGLPVSGQVRLLLSAADPDRGRISAGYRAAVGGGVGPLDPVGEAYVELTDPTGLIAYNVAPGRTATMRFWPSSARLASGVALPASLPAWTFDEAAGLWRQTGTATLQGGAYTFEASHFSRIAVGAAESGSACVRVRVDGSLDLPARVRVSIPTSATTERVDEFVLKDELNVLYQLPPSTVVSVVPLDRSGDPIETAGQSVDVGEALPAGVADPPPWPYQDCGRDLLLTRMPRPLGFDHGWTFLWAEGRPKRGQEAQETRAYYQAIDPQALRTTLGGWWRENGFDTAGGGGTRGAFLNNAELAYWRDHHCLERPSGDVACYVGKYLDGRAAVAGDASWTAETVVMEYREVVPGAGRTVTFAAYAGATADAPRVENADFDGTGYRYVPWVCLNCHGGTYDPVDGLKPTPGEIDLGASFLMFDLERFGFSSQWPEAEQLAALKDLNEIVLATHPNAAVRELIEGWYTSGGDTPDLDWAPETFSDGPQAELYREIIAPSCRTCHVTQDGLEWDVYLDQERETDTDVALPKIRNLYKLLACGTHHMPHARPTFTRFWTSDQPELLAGYSDPRVGWEAFGRCE